MAAWGIQEETSRGEVLVNSTSTGVLLVLFASPRAAYLLAQHNQQLT